MMAMSSRTGPSALCFASILNQINNKTGVFDHYVIDNTPALDVSRNELMRYFLENTTLDYLMWVDDDVILPSNIGELLTIDEPFISPLCWIIAKGRPSPGVYTWKEGYMITTISPARLSMMMTELTEQGKPPILYNIDAVGGGVNMIRRDVVETCVDEHGEWYRYVWDDPMNRVRRAEDLYFFKMAQEHGYKLTVHLGVECGHEKIFDIRTIAKLMFRGPPDLVESEEVKIDREAEAWIKERKARLNAEAEKKNEIQTP